MHYSRISSITLAIAAAVAMIGCGEEPKPVPPPAPIPAPPPPKPEITVQFGHVAPLTGPQANLGLDNENGVRMAIDELNSKDLEIGGAKIKFALMAEDDQANPEQSTAAAQKLVEAKVNGVIGHLDAESTISASKTYSEAGIPQITGSVTNPKYTQQGFATTFRLIANDAQQGKALGDYAVNKLAAKTIAIIDDRSAYGQVLADEVEKAVVAAGGKVVVRESSGEKDKPASLTTLLNKIKSKKADIVFFGGMDIQGGPIAKQMKSRGVKAKFLTANGSCTQEFIKLAGPASEGQYCSLPGVPLDQMPGGKTFGEAFATRYGPVQLSAPYTYDAVMVMVDAMKRADSVEPGKYLAEIGKANYQGVTSKIQFDDKGDLKDGAISLYQIKDGKLEYRETIGGAPVVVEEAKEAVQEAATTVKDTAIAPPEAAKAAADAAKPAAEKK